MGEQGLLDLDILTEAELEKAKEEQQHESTKKPRKTKPKEKKESGPESTENSPQPSEERASGEGTDGSSSTVQGDGANTRSRSGNAKGSSSSSKEPSVRPDGWNVNVIGTAPGHKNPNPWFEGVLAFDPQTHDTSTAAFKDIRNASRVIYVDDIHLENPTVIETKFFISGTFYDVVAGVTEDVFTEIVSDKRIKLNNVHYSYVSCERGKKRRRNYQLKNEDRWPTEEEIKEMDKHFDSIDYATMSYSERERYKQDKASKGEAVEVVEEEEIPLPQEPEEEPQDNVEETE